MIQQDRELEELKDLENEKKNVVDEASSDDTSAPQTYNISSYGADFDVDGLVKRLSRGDILIPSFQREYVWNLSDASRFVESLLLGLPVPGIFLAKESDSNKSLVIDGQQRLKSLQFFYEGYFNPKKDQKARRVFRLKSVQPQFENKTYDTLDESDKIRLNDSIIHATIIKQESPEGDDTSVYHVFERLNTGGRKLTPQEIRAAIYHGLLIQMLSNLNSYQDWRRIFSTESNRLKDQELILRFLALYQSHKTYIKPISEFLNKYNKVNRNPSIEFVTQYSNLFKETISYFYSALGTEAFRPERALNAAVFDSMMVGLANRIESGSNISVEQVEQAYKNLISDEAYKSKVSESTSDTERVKERIALAIKYFKEI